MSGRGERLLWKIVGILSAVPAIGWWVPPPEILGRMDLADACAPSEADAEPVIDPAGLDDWLASILDELPDSG
jgi:hypothetical protein